MNRRVRRLFILPLLLFLIISQGGCGENTDFLPGSGQPVSRTGYYLDTVCTITVYDVAADSDLGRQLDGLDSSEAREAAIGQAIEEAFSVCSSYEKLLSKTVAGSDVDRINHGGGQPVAVGPDALSVIEKGLRFGALSEGAFDITIGKASALWDFHQLGGEDGQDRVPDAEALKEAVAHVDYRQVAVDREAGTVRLGDPEMEIDLGGIAKGYIADRLSDYLAGQGVTSAIIDLGGNIVVLGGKPSADAAEKDGAAGVSGTPAGSADGGAVGTVGPDGAGEGSSGTGGTDGEAGGTDEEAAETPADTAAGQVPFLVGLKDPNDPQGALLGTLSCRDKAVVTSGTYERFVEKDGVRYHHILDPATGWPVDTDIDSVTIIAHLGMSAEADGLSTACLALGTERAMALLADMDGVEAVLVSTGGEILETREGLLTRR